MSEPTPAEIEQAAAAIAKEGFPKGHESAREYRLRLAKAALRAGYARPERGGE